MGTTSSPFHFGRSISTDLANYKGIYTYGGGSVGTYLARTVPVGSFPGMNLDCMMFTAMPASGSRIAGMTIMTVRHRMAVSGIQAMNVNPAWSVVAPVVADRRIYVPRFVSDMPWKPETKVTGSALDGLLRHKSE